MKFKTGDIVRIGVHPKAVGTIAFPINYSQQENITVYRVSLGDGFAVNVPDTHLKLYKEYDGNEPSNWADLRHIWRPEMD